MSIDFKALASPFKVDVIKWRVGHTASNGRVCMLPYIDARVVQKRLDEVVGPANWSVTYDDLKDGIRSTLSIRINDEWVTKDDAGSCSDIEPLKGGVSDAFKRAAVAWGVGRHLYDMPKVWCDVRSDKPRSGGIRVKGGWVVVPNRPKPVPVRQTPMSDDEADRFLKALKGIGANMADAVNVANEQGIDLESREGRVALFRLMKKIA